MKNSIVNFTRFFVVLSLLLGFLRPGGPPTTAQNVEVSLLKQIEKRKSPKEQILTTSVEWDDVDSHRWIGEPWGDAVSTEWVDFDGRNVLQATIANTSGAQWGLMRTDAFPAEDWDAKTGFRADIYQVGGASGIDVKLEIRGEAFDPTIEAPYCLNIQPNTWYTCTWNFNSSFDYSQVMYLSMVFDFLANSEPTFYVDNLRLVNNTSEEAWDDMDDGSRNWGYGGNWFDWGPDPREFGLELISHNGNNPTTPAGSLFLQWDYNNGVSTDTNAAIGTDQLADLNDWSGFNRISADVKVSDPNVPLSVFLWDADADPAYRGFGTPPRVVGVADTWQRVTWDLPWPYGFDNTDVDEVKFIVNNIDTHLTGTLFIDNISLDSDPLPAPVTGLSYIFENYDDNNSMAFNDFNGNWGVLNGDYITAITDTTVYSGTWGASLRLDYALPPESFTGKWDSLWGHSDYDETMFLDFTDIYGNLEEGAKDFEQLQFWVRGSGNTTAVHNVKVELKDTAGNTAYRYITIADSDLTWQKVVLDADVENASFWQYTEQGPPNISHMKELVFVVESYFNPPAGTFYIDGIQFVDAEDAPFDPNAHTDDEFLDFVSKKTFLYFLDWYDPNTGLFHDRSTFPDQMSIASTGFGLTALAIGESRGWITHTLAVEMITHTLQSVYNGQPNSTTQSEPGTNTNGYRGFFYHFLGTDGYRIGNTELSSVDTAIFLFGALTVKEYFHDVPEIVELVDQLYARVDWAWMLDLDAGPESDHQWFYLAWKPECGGAYIIPADGGCFTNIWWDYYTDEAMMINLLAIGSPTPEYRVSKDVFYEWARNWGTYDGQTLIQSWSGSLFTYFFAHLWIDFDFLGKDNHPDPDLQIDWWENSIAATQANRQFALDHQDDTVCDNDDNYTTYGPNSWGLTASDGPDDQYYAYGALPAGIPPEFHKQDGTVQPYGAGSSIMFLPEESLSALKHYFSETDLWRYRFGFGDAYSLDTPDCNNPWYNHAGFGIDQGPMLIAIENYRSGLIWDIFQQNHELGEALCAVWCDLTISGPTEVYVNQPVFYTASISPSITATLPLTYVWEVDEQMTMTRTGGLSDEVSFIWDTAGTKTIHVIVSNSVTSITDTIYVTVSEVAPASVTIVGPVIGTVNISYTFTAYVSPISTTEPITYQWWVDGAPFSIAHTGGVTDAITLAWPTTGEKTVQVNVSNAVGNVTDTIAVTIYPVPPTEVIITGPVTGTVGNTFVFTATVSPISTTLPITYVWEATDYDPFTHTSGLTDVITLSWTTPGEKVITVTVTNGDNITVTQTHHIVIQPRFVYLPIIVRGEPPPTIIVYWEGKKMGR